MSTQMLSRYEILGSLGKGGMGEVLKARDAQLKRVVAIKRLLPGTLGDGEAKARFLREARLAAQLNHPNIATIYDIFDADGEAFIVMEYVEGDTLRDRVARGPLPLPEVFDLSTQIASAVATAHKLNVIHRDIKSENIKITPDGHVKVLDFGLAKQIHTVDATVEDTIQAESLFVTQQGFAAGTPGYTAPEQWRGGQVDGRADIFSFGVVLYEMITGRAPFPGQSVIERITATMHHDPEPVTNYASVPNQLEWIVRKALAKDPDRRYQSMTEVLQELDHLRHQPMKAGEAPTAIIMEPSQEILAGRYKILAELGEGGMGKVYQAKDLKLDRTVAIKELRQGILADEKARARFLREASLLAQLNHRNIATIHDIIEEESQIFIIMEYIEGERLLDKIKRGPLPPEQTYLYALEIAEALAEAHSRRIIHRDIKSANIMTTPSGHVKVLDFGLAKQIAASTLSETGQSPTMAAELTGTRITFGTPKYMSPEQRMTADVDERSDIFSYGVVLCEMLVGEIQFMGEVMAELLDADAKLWPSPLDRIPIQWQPIVKKSLAKDPRHRYQTFTDLITDLKGIKGAAEARTEFATGVIERPVVKKVEGPRIAPTLLRSALALAPGLYFLHKVAEYAGQNQSFYYLPFVFLVPIAVFQLPRWIMPRLKVMQHLVASTHPLAFSLMMLNLVLVLLTSFSILDSLGWQGLGDWRYWINKEEISPDIVLVGIDEKTKRGFEAKHVQLREPEDLIKLRQFHPQVLRNIAKANPRVIGMDLYFNNASEQYDKDFADALRQVQATGIPVIVAKYFDEGQGRFMETTPAVANALTDKTGQFTWGHPVALESKDEITRVVPIRLIQKEWKEVYWDRQFYPSISFLMAKGGEYNPEWEVSDNVYRAGQMEIPIDRTIHYVKGLSTRKYQYEYDNLIVNFPSEPFQSVSYYDVYNGQTDINFLGKYVLIGSDYPQFETYKHTPLEPWSPFKIHASALNTIFRHSFIKRIPPMLGLIVVLLASYFIFSCGFKLPARSWVLLAVTGGVCVLLFVVAISLFLSNRTWVDASYPSVAAVVTGVLMYWKR